jgi:hypothetical protein
MVLETDYYFVWSDLMKKELLFYYPYIKKKNKFLLGLRNLNLILIQNKFSKEVFFEQNDLDLDKKIYLLFSDDVNDLVLMILNIRRCR